MNHNKCLNCNSETENNYCSHCGQKTSTHRFSLQHFLAHDLVHGVFHLDKGFLFTVKELFTRPGHSIREYVQGKRVKHFNAFTAIIFVLTITLVITGATKVKASEIYNQEQLSEYSKLLREYYKLIILSGIPFYALGSYFIFKKTKQNYTENLVLNTYLTIGMLILGLIFPIITVFYTNVNALYYLKAITPILNIIYIFWFYYQYFSGYEYKKVSLIIRTLLITVYILLINGAINALANKIGVFLQH
jgi:hypothetical protein